MLLVEDMALPLDGQPEALYAGRDETYRDAPGDGERGVDIVGSMHASE